jgi:hypothetical protein
MVSRFFGHARFDLGGDDVGQEVYVSLPEAQVFAEEYSI